MAHRIQFPKSDMNPSEDHESCMCAWNNQDLSKNWYVALKEALVMEGLGV